jgi:hypothetical protein
MIRRTIAMALAGLALAAPPALAHSHWNSQMKDAAQTASRSAGGCTIKPGRHNSLQVTCDGRHTATLVYVFSVGHGGHVQGTPTSGVSSWGHARVHRSVKVSAGTVKVTVTATAGMVQLYSVSVGYYA